jgi:hypothetical protein
LEVIYCDIRYLSAKCIDDFPVVEFDLSIQDDLVEVVLSVVDQGGDQFHHYLFELLHRHLFSFLQQVC